MKVVNLFALTKKGSVSWSAKPKSTKKGDNSFETCSNIVPYKESLPPLGNIVIENSPSPSAHTCSSRISIVAKPRPPSSKPTVDAPPSSKIYGCERKTSPLAPSVTAKRRVCYL